MWRTKGMARETENKKPWQNRSMIERKHRKSPLVEAAGCFKKKRRRKNKKALHRREKNNNKKTEAPSVWNTEHEGDVGGPHCACGGWCKVLFFHLMRSQNSGSLQTALGVLLKDASWRRQSMWANRRREGGANPHTASSSSFCTFLHLTRSFNYSSTCGWVYICSACRTGGKKQYKYDVIVPKK